MSRFSQFTGSSSSGGTLTGEVKTFLNGTTATGYLALNGQCVSKTEYADLYSAIGDQEPPITDTSDYSSVLTTPTGWPSTERLVYGPVQMGCCGHGFAAIHGLWCCGTKLCYKLSNGLEGAVCGCSCICSSYLCGVQDKFYAGYDCNTDKFYVAAHFSRTYGGGTCSGATWMQVWNLTDCSHSGCFVQSGCYYTCGCMVSFGCTGLCLQQSTYSPIAIMGVCFPNKCQFNVSGMNGTQMYCVGGCPEQQTFARYVCCTSKNPDLLVGFSSVGNYSPYSGLCMCGGIWAYNVTTQCGCAKCTGGCYSCFTSGLPYRLCEGTCFTGTCHTLTWYPDSNQVNFGSFTTATVYGGIAVIVPYYRTCCGSGYSICSRYWPDPVRTMIRTITVPKASVDTPVPTINCCDRTAIYSDASTSTCKGICRISYFNKCSAWIGQAVAVTSYDLYACGTSLFSATCSFVSSTSLPTSDSSAALGITSASTCSGDVLGFVGPAFESTCTSLLTYGASTLGPTSNVFLVPNISATSGLGYFVKT